MLPGYRCSAPKPCLAVVLQGAHLDDDSGAAAGAHASDGDGASSASAAAAGPAAKRHKADDASTSQELPPALGASATSDTATTGGDGAAAAAPRGALIGDDGGPVASMSPPASDLDASAAAPSAPAVPCKPYGVTVTDPHELHVAELLDLENPMPRRAHAALLRVASQLWEGCTLHDVSDAMSRMSYMAASAFEWARKWRWPNSATETDDEEEDKEKDEEEELTGDGSGSSSAAPALADRMASAVRKQVEAHAAGLGNRAYALQVSVSKQRGYGDAVNRGFYGAMELLERGIEMAPWEPRSESVDLARMALRKEASAMKQALRESMIAPAVAAATEEMRQLAVAAAQEVITRGGMCDWRMRLSSALSAVSETAVEALRAEVAERLPEIAADMEARGEMALRLLAREEAWWRRRHLLLALRSRYPQHDAATGAAHSSDSSLGVQAAAM